MTKKKIDITSTVLEKGIDLAKGFLDKLIMPSVEETGLLLKDKVTLWRFNNQIKMLIKAKEYCEKNSIKPKAVSMKLLVPLLENASLEEDDFLQDKWAVLLSNLVDSEQNIQNHVFPYLLGQISIKEYAIIEETWLSKVKRVDKLNEELELLIQEKPNIEKRVYEEIDKLKQTIPLPHDLSMTIYKLEREIKELNKKVLELKTNIFRSESLNHFELEEFELSNLVRLGIIKLVIEHTAYAEPIMLPSPNQYDYDSNYINIDVGIESNGDSYLLTELGELFISACTEKNKNQ